MTTPTGPTMTDGVAGPAFLETSRVPELESAALFGASGAIGHGSTAGASVDNHSPQEGEDPNNKKKRSSVYKGVTRHRRTGRWEAHVRVRVADAPCGKQVYLGGFEHEDLAAEAYDIAVLHSKGWMTETNFERSRYRELYDAIKHMDFQDVVQLIRKCGDIRGRAGVSDHQGVTRQDVGGGVQWLCHVKMPVTGEEAFVGAFVDECEAALTYFHEMIKLWAPHWGAPRGNMCAAPAAPTAQLPAFVDSPHHEPSTYQLDVSPTSEHGTRLRKRPRPTPGSVESSAGGAYPAVSYQIDDTGAYAAGTDATLQFRAAKSPRHSTSAAGVSPVQARRGLAGVDVSDVLSGLLPGLDGASGRAVSAPHYPPVSVAAGAAPQAQAPHYPHVAVAPPLPEIGSATGSPAVQSPRLPPGAGANLWGASPRLALPRADVDLRPQAHPSLTSPADVPAEWDLRGCDVPRDSKFPAADDASLLFEPWRSPPPSLVTDHSLPELFPGLDEGMFSDQTVLDQFSETVPSAADAFNMLSSDPFAYVDSADPLLISGGD